MWWTLALLVVPVVAFRAAPVLFARGSWWLRRPSLCLTGWFALFALGVGTALAAVVRLVLLGLRPAGNSMAAALAAPVAAWLALGLAAGAVSAVAMRAARLVGSERRLRRDLGRLVRDPRTRHVAWGRAAVHIVASSDVVVCSLRRRRPQVIVSSRVVGSVSVQELRALIAHETAHLRRGHDVAARLAELNCACLPGRRTTEEMRRRTHLLGELAADRAAARRVGPEAIGSALLTLSGLTTEGSLRLRAQVVRSIAVARHPS